MVFTLGGLNEFESSGSEIAIDVAGAFARKQETMRLVPRTAAAELTAEIELARLQKANEIAELLNRQFAGRQTRPCCSQQRERPSRSDTCLISTDRPMSAIADITGRSHGRAHFYGRDPLA